MHGNQLRAAIAWAGCVGWLLLALLTSSAAYQGFDCGQGEQNKLIEPMSHVILQLT
jgi:hypothetical protein